MNPYRMKLKAFYIEYPGTAQQIEDLWNKIVQEYPDAQLNSVFNNGNEEPIMLVWI